jgi:hypothetical protein
MNMRIQNPGDRIQNIVNSLLPATHCILYSITCSLPIVFCILSPEFFLKIILAKSNIRDLAQSTRF